MTSVAPMKTMPLWRDSQQLLLLIEQAVRHFSRYHKYTLGTDMRRQAMRICRLLARAYNDKEHRLSHVIKLNEAVDDLKIQIQLAKELAAFRHFKEFDTIARLAVAVGKQSGRWRQRLHTPTT